MAVSNVLLGLATGIPVMIIVGPIALLLIEQGLERGLRGGLPAALGVASADLTFASLTAVAGVAAAAVIQPFEPVLRVGAVVLLAGLAARVWRSAGRDRVTALAARPAELVGATVGPSQALPVAGVPAPEPAAGPMVRGLGFFALTALNPLTVVVFASIVLGGGAGTGTLGWVVGMVLASLMVNLGFVAIGHGLGAVLDDAATAGLRMAAAVLIVAMAVYFALA